MLHSGCASCEKDETLRFCQLLQELNSAMYVQACYTVSKHDRILFLEQWLKIKNEKQNM